MKTFIFKQDNDFGDTLSMTVIAPDIEEAKNIIRLYIIKNTRAPKSAYSHGIDVIRDMVEESTKHWERLQAEDLDNKHTQFFLNQYEEKSFFLTSTEKYSINDFKKDDSLYEFFAEREAMRTHLWFFENKEYKLDEIDTTQSSIANVDFLYSGK